MENTQKSKAFQQRLKSFALICAKLTKELPSDTQNKEYGKQLIRSSASPGANYSEALCAITRKDFAYDINKCRKESKESHYWLDLLKSANPNYSAKIESILNEAESLVKIFQKISSTLRNNK